MHKREFNKIFKDKYNNWVELEEKIKSLPTENERGKAFEDFCYAYFNIKKDLYNAKEIYTYDSDITEEVKSDLKIEDSDYGIDGIIKTDLDEYITYQAKFRSDRSTPTYRELSTFWAESEQAMYRCIISNCYDLAKVSKKKSNQFLILVDSLLELDQNFFEQLYDFYCEKEQIVVEKKKPLDHQKNIIDNTVKGFETHDRGKIIAACGTGKTLTSLWITEKMSVSSVLFVVPSLSLLKQTVDEWLKEKNIDFNFICVCSDDTVVPDNDDVFIDNINELGFPVTTSPNEISKFLSLSNRKVVFSTYQSLDAVSLAMNNMEEFQFDLAIFDEAHKTVGLKYGNMFGLGLSDEFIRIKKRLFMTATEKYIRKRANSVLGNEYECYSMEDEKIYGPVFSKLSFGDAIKQNIICDYRIVVNCINDSDLDFGIKNNMLANSDGKNIDLNNLYKQLSLLKIMDGEDINKVITFHNSILNAKRFIFGDEKNLPIVKLAKDKDIFASHINGTYNANKRKRIFDEFEQNKISILSNAHCLTEGVDIPLIDAVYFADNKGSLIDIIQAIGRALRKPKNSNKTMAYVVLPIIIPESATDITNLNEQFETFHNVLQALREEDETISEWIDLVNYSITNKTVNKKSNYNYDKIIINVPGNIDITSFYDQLSYRIAVNNKESIKVVFDNSNVIKDRTSNFKRFFKTIGDYSIASLLDQLIIPTIDRYIFYNCDCLNKKDIIINHNNISHCKRLGIIKENGENYILTEKGKLLKHKKVEPLEFLRKQLLLYKDNGIFTYRAFFKILYNCESVSKFEFIYCIYTLNSDDESSINEAVDRVNYIKETYDNINLMSRNNQEKTLNILNSKYDLAFSFDDVWSSRTTVYNQFNYFKNHVITLYPDIVEFSSVNDSISIVDKEKMLELMKETEYIESVSDEEYEELYIGLKNEK